MTVSQNGKIEKATKKSTVIRDESHLEMKWYHCRGYHILLAGERPLFRGNELLSEIKRVIRFLQLKEFPVNPFLVIYYSQYSGDELSIIEMNHLDAINEKNVWLEDRNCDGFLHEPAVEFPLK